MQRTKFRSFIGYFVAGRNKYLFSRNRKMLYHSLPFRMRQIQNGESSAVPRSRSASSIIGLCRTTRGMQNEGMVRKATVKAESKRTSGKTQKGRRSSLGEKSRGAEVASTELARKINRDLVLELVRMYQPIARVDLARASGLQNSTVSVIVEQLIEEGWIREGEALKTPRGRRPTQISLNDQVAMLVADIHPGRAVLATVDLNGLLLDQREICLSPAVKQSVTKLGNALAALRDEHDERVFMGLGVCVPGRVDGQTGRLIVAPNLHWQNYDIRAALNKRLGLPVEMENDANACLLSELWFGRLDGVRNAVLLAISEGLGGSLLADSHLISGRLGLAGEFGHICVAPSGPQCECGRHGCWEMFASSRAALAHYHQRRPHTPQLDYRELARLAEAGDEHAVAAIDLQARAIGRGLRMVTAALAPELILFAGDISYAWKVAHPAILEECKRTLLVGKVPRLVCTGDGRKAHLLGAGALVLQRHSGYYRSRSADRAANAQTVGKRLGRAALV